MKNAKGFTLIEILVTMVIIGILTTAATVSFEKARAKSRDTVRKNDLLSISIALESRYAYEKNYPGGQVGCGGHKYNYDSQCVQPWIPYLADYLDPLPIEKGPKVGDYNITDNPCDPPFNNDLRNYQYRIPTTDNAHYHLFARLELNDAEAIKNSTNCSAPAVIIPPNAAAGDFTTTITGYPIYALYK